MFKVPFDVEGLCKEIWPDLISESAVPNRIFCDPRHYSKVPEAKRMNTMYIVLSPFDTSILEAMDYYINSQEVKDYVISRWNSWHGSNCSNIESFAARKTAK